MLGRIKRYLKTKLKPNVVPIIKIEGMENLLNNKVALVTGGAGGIGFAIAEELINSGCKVILTGRNENKLKQSCTTLNKINSNSASYITLDQSEIDIFDKKIEEAIDIYGKIDILINSSGTHISRKDLDLSNITEQEYDEVMNLNLKGTYFFTQKISNYMIKNKIKGHILFISSSRGAEPVWSPYQISKLAINGITEGFAKQLAHHGIIVNGIAPGPTATTLIDFKEGDSIYTEDTLIERYTLPLEVATYVKFLVSDVGNTIIGQTIYLSGGRGIVDKR